MKYVFYFLIAALIFVFWSMWNDREMRAKLRARLKREWGKVPEEEYTSEKFESIKAYYNSIKDDLRDVDDITWNDLDMDEIYMILNNTQSSVGEEYLYSLLRKPCFDPNTLNERNRLMKFFTAEEEKRINLQVALSELGKISHISVYEYLNRLKEQEKKSNLKHYVMIFGLIAAIALIFVKPVIGGVGTLIMVVTNIYQYYKEKAEIEKFLNVFAYLFRLLDSIHKISNLDIPEIQSYTDDLKKDADVFKSFRKGASILTSKNVSGSITDSIVDYFRMLFHIDLIKYNSMLGIFKSNLPVLNRIFENIGILDSMCAAASFRVMLPLYCEPVLVKNNRPAIAVTDLYHPLLESPIPNSITENHSVLITGSNASGKSTFIKTLAMNAILSQTIDTSLSRSYHSNYFMVYSSMALKDNLFNKESYYIVEIKSLKRILDRVNPDIPILCFIDEVLRGTNTLERIAASSRILASLAKKNTLVFAATHDIELTHILEAFYSNYHFQEKIENHTINFDYKLYKGRAVSKNAIKLLELLGYSQDIINDAEKAAEYFLTQGEWSNME